MSTVPASRITSQTATSKRTVVVDQNARYFGTKLREGSLVPGGKARTGQTSFEACFRWSNAFRWSTVEGTQTCDPSFVGIKGNGVAMSTLRILGAALVLAFGSQPIQSARAAESAVVTPLMLKELADIPGKEMLMITVDYPPGAVDPVHRHDAHAFVYVLQGSIVMQVRGGKEVTLVPGQTFYEGPNDVHTVGRNASTTEPAKFIVILLKKKGVDVVLLAE